ncbi:hypothetical protein ACFIQF_22590 [Comamonas sp. J-3]|uniref:hypothetical protein n=1 Tax=Comamonas trifloxystrobinivorans TaxID=3350256 RepID=UPI003729308F
MATDAPNAMATAIEEVKDKMQYFKGLAGEHLAALHGSMGQIADVRMVDVPAPELLEVPKLNPPAIRAGTMPTYTPTGLVMPNDPVLTSIGSLLSNLDVGDMDALPEAPAMPVLTVPTAPVMDNIPAPQRPAIDTNVDIPTAPNIALPDMEVLSAITVPDFVFPELPDFDGNPPNADSIVVPNVFINWREPEYESELLDTLEAQIKHMMAGGTGLPAAIEDALFSRARERDSAETARAVQEAVDTWAARGYTMPPGMLTKAAGVIREQGRLKAAETNRDILTQAATWQIENIRFAVQQGMALEQLLQNLFENTAKRLFEMARFEAESQINLFNAHIGLFNAKNQAFATLAQVFRTKLDAALAKLTAYKTYLEGQAAIGQLNQQKVEVFKAKLAGVQASTEIYNSMMRGAQVQSDVIKNQFDAYRADVQAFAEQIGAQKLKFDAYSSQVKAEEAKAGMLESQSRAYAATVGAIASKSEIRYKGAQVKMEAARIWLAKYQAEWGGYRDKVSASLQQLQYGTEVFKTQVEGFRALTTLGISEAEVQSKYADMAVRTNIAYSEMAMGQYNALSQRAYQQAQITLEGSKAIGAWGAQLAAGAMSAMHVSASVSGSGSNSNSWSESKSTSDSTSKNYNY